MQSYNLCRRAWAALLAVAYAALPAFGSPLSPTSHTGGASALNLDLSSSQGSIAASANLSGTTIHLGSANNALSITTGQLLTPAEYLAALQVLNNGKQALILGSNGSAAGGSFRVTPTLGSLGELVIPKNVTVIDYFAGRSTLSLASSFNDYGSLLGIAKPGSSLNITAGNISVFPTGSISTFSATASGPVNLSIYSAGNIENAGSISSSGRLQLAAAGSITNDTGATISGANQVTLSSGDGQITNNGTISSQSGNLLLSTTAEAGFVVNNESGLLEAGNHAVIFDAGNSGQIDQLTGGDVTGKSIDFHGRNGDLQANTDSLDGVVNIDTKSAHVATDSGFKLGKLKVSGDPTFDMSGSLSPFTFTQNMTVPLGQALTVIASGVIDKDQGVTQIKSTGGAITLLAGVSSTPNTIDTVTSSPSGSESIELGGVNVTSSTTKANGFGGVILMVSSSEIQIGNINSSAPGGTGGRVTLQAPGTITTGSITTVGRNGGGNVAIDTAPVTLTSSAQYDNTTGIPEQGGDPFSSGTVVNGRVFVTGNITSSSKSGPGGAVTILTYDQVRVTGNINSSGAAGGKSFTFPHTGGSVTLASGNDSISVLGSITASGENNGATSISLTSSTGIDVVKNIIATGTGGSGSVELNVDTAGDIRVGFNPLNDFVAGTDPLLFSQHGGINVSSSGGPAGSVQINANSGNVSIANSVNASGFISGGTIHIQALEHLLIDGTVSSNSADGPGGHIQLGATAFSTPNLLYGMDIGGVTATGKFGGGNIILDAESTPMLVRGGLNVSSTNGAAGLIETNSLLDTVIRGSVLATGPQNSAATTAIELDAGLNGGAVVNGGELTLLGTINTSSTQGTGGLVSLLGQTGVTVGAITTSGLLGGGQITADSADGILTVNGNINTSTPNVTNGQPATAGNVYLNSGTGTSNTGAATIVNGNIIAKGGSALGSSNPGQGGGGGIVYISTVEDPIAAVWAGTVKVGSIDTQGGNTTNTLGLAGGAGGPVTITAATVQFTSKSTGGASVNTTGGSDPFKNLTNGGAITIVTDALQPIPSDLNLASTKQTDFAIPGAMFQVGNASVNGSAGIFLSNTGSTINKVGNGMLTTSGGSGNIAIDILATGTATYDRNSVPQTVGPTTNIDGKIVRTTITPAEALALYQTTRGIVQTFGLTNQGGAADTADNGSVPNNITIQVPAEFSKNFTAFNIATQDNAASSLMRIVIDVNDTTPSVYIGLPKNAPSNINQPIIVVDDNPPTATIPALVDIHAGAAPIDVGTGGAVVTDAGSSGLTPNLRISSVGTLNINNNGTLQGGLEALQGPGGIKVTSGAGSFLNPSSLEISGATGMQTPTGGFSFLSTAPNGDPAPVLEGVSTIIAKSIDVGFSKASTLPSTQFLDVQYWDIYGPISIFTADKLTFGTAIPGETDHVYAQGPINVEMFASTSTNTFIGDVQIITPSSFSLISTANIQSTSTSLVRITAGTNLSLETEGTVSDGGGTWQFNALKGTMVMGSTLSNVSLTSLSDEFTSFGNMSIFATGVINTGNATSGPSYQCETGTLSVGSYRNGNLDVVNDANDQIGGFFESRNVVMNLGNATGTASIDPTIAGNFRIAGSIAINFTGNQTFGVIGPGATLDARTGVSIFGDDNITILSSSVSPTEIFSTGGTVSIKTPTNAGVNIEIGQDALIGAGSPVFGCCSTTAPILKSQVASAGNVDIEAGGTVTIDGLTNPSNTNFQTVGGNIVIKSFSGAAISLGNQSSFQALGGNIEILGEDGVLGGSTTSGGPPGNRFVATSLVNGKSITGGGVEIQGGTTTSTIAILIAHRPKPFSNQIDASQTGVLLSSSPNTKGEVLIGSTATVTLNSTSSPGLSMIVGGQNSVVVIKGNNVTLDSVVIGSTTPVSESETDDANSDLIVDADTDDQ